jgi:hypothetical protein
LLNEYRLSVFALFGEDQTRFPHEIESGSATLYLKRLFKPGAIFEKSQLYFSGAAIGDAAMVF